MTREEAIEKLELMRQKVDEETYRALILAIKALEQEPTFDDECQKDMDEAWEQIQKKEKRIPVTLDLTPCDDAISRQAALDCFTATKLKKFDFILYAREEIKKLPSVTQESGEWILVSERLPEDTYPVNITWVNHNPESYYADIKDKPFTATGCYCDGKWYWYSVTCQDYLDEYRYCDVDSMDEAIEVTAWMPLPKPYKAESEDKE